MSAAASSSSASSSSKPAAAVHAATPAERPPLAAVSTPASKALLDSLKNPSDLRKFSMDDLTALAGEVRHRIVEAVSKNGGHLASNLGVVELTIALHYVYDFGPYPKGPDRLLFDVGHQCYPHKLLTGRADKFDTLRQKGSVGGIPTPD